MAALWIVMGLLFFLLGVIIYVLFVPFTIYANTWEGKYYFLIPGLLRILLIKTENTYEGRLRLFFVSFKIGADKHLFRFEKLFKKSDKKARNKKKRQRYNLKKRTRSFYLFIIGIFKSFKVKQFDVTFDTGDFTLNAFLVPAFSAINGDTYSISINFNEQYGLIARMKNRLFNFLRLGLIFYIRNRKARIK